MTPWRWLEIAMEDGEHTSAPVEEPLVSWFGLLRAEQHYNRVLAEEEERTSTLVVELPMFVFRMLQAEKRYILSLLEEHRLAE